MTDEELIARLRVQRTTDEMTTEECAGADYEYAYNMVVQDCHAAAIRIHSLGLLHDMAEAKAEAAEARAERLEAALRVARVHVANNAEGWSVSRGAARNDLTIVDAALSATTEEGHE